NGLWLLEHFKGKVNGHEFEGMGATSYDAGKKKYVNVWIDTMSTLPMVSEGTFDAEKKTMTMTGQMAMPNGKTMKCTQTIVIKDANTKTFTLRGEDGGKEFEMVSITYKRRAGGKCASVDGQVMLDGRPLDQGSITFFPRGDTQRPTVSAVI